MISFIRWWAVDKLGPCPLPAVQVAAISQLQRIIQRDRDDGNKTKRCSVQRVVIKVNGTVKSYLGEFSFVHTLLTWWLWRTSNTELLFSPRYYDSPPTYDVRACLCIWLYATIWLQELVKTFNPGDPGGALHQLLPSIYYSAPQGNIWRRARGPAGEVSWVERSLYKGWTSAVLCRGPPAHTLCPPKQNNWIIWIMTHMDTIRLFIRDFNCFSVLF